MDPGLSFAETPWTASDHETPDQLCAAPGSGSSVTTVNRKLDVLLILSLHAWAMLLCCLILLFYFDESGGRRHIHFSFRKILEKG